MTIIAGSEITVTKRSIYYLAFHHISTREVGIKVGDTIKIDSVQAYAFRKYASFTFNGHLGFCNVEDLTK